MFLGTSAWVALMGGDASLGTVLAGRPTMGSLLLLAEVASLVERGRLPADNVLTLLESVQLDAPQPDDCLQAGPMHGLLRAAGNRKVSLADCIMYQGARRHGIPFVTGDHDLKGQPGVRLIKDGLRT